MPARWRRARAPTLSCSMPIRWSRSLIHDASRRYICAVPQSIAASCPSGANPMLERRVPYQLDGRAFEGMIVCDDGVKARRPALFMQPDWKDVCADTVAQARTIAGKDYVVLMADMYGVGYGNVPKTREELA